LEAHHIPSRGREDQLNPPPRSRRLEAIAHGQPILARLQLGLAVVTGLVAGEEGIVLFFDELPLALALVFERLDFLLAQFPYDRHCDILSAKNDNYSTASYRESTDDATTTRNHLEHQYAIVYAVLSARIRQTLQLNQG
jgi:hypothetical protein